MRTAFPILSQYGLRISHFAAPAGEALRGHSHDSAHLFFLFEGTMAQRAGRREVELGRLDARLSGPDARHDIDFGTRGGICAVVHFDGTDTAGTRFLAPEHAHMHAAALRRALAEPAHAPLALLEAAWSVANLRGMRGQSPDWLREARRRLLAPEPPRVHKLARALGVSREHFARAFAAAFGVSAQFTRRCARATHAATALSAGTALSGAMFAYERGYADQSHLIRDFTALFGMTPREFAVRHHKNPIPAP